MNGWTLPMTSEIHSKFGAWWTHICAKWVYKEYIRNLLNGSVNNFLQDRTFELIAANATYDGNSYTIYLKTIFRESSYIKNSKCYDSFSIDGSLMHKI